MTSSKIIYTTIITEKEIEEERDWLRELEPSFEPAEEELYDSISIEKTADWENFVENIREYDLKYKGSYYIIKGNRVTHPQYAGYIGKGGEYHPVTCDTLYQAILKCCEMGEEMGAYDSTIRETSNGTLQIETVDHDGSCYFSIYRINKRRNNIRFRKFLKEV